MIRRYLTRVISNAGKRDYIPDMNLSERDLLVISVSRTVDLIRGLYFKLAVKESRGLLFVGSRCRIKHKAKIRFGQTVTIGRNVEINALSEEGIQIGNNVSILSNTIIECTGVIRSIGVGLTIGNNVGISQNCFIQVRGKVTIGNDVIIGPGVSIFSENHNFNDPSLPVRLQGETRKGVTIEEGAWIGTKAIILDGVRVGRNSIVAAGSIVTRDVPSYAIVGGVPARVLKERKMTNSKE